MANRHTRDELEGLQALGDLADDMVVALGRVVRSEPLSERELQALKVARSLFELMTSHDVIVVGTAVGRMLGDESSYLDALRVVQRQADGGTIEDYGRRYAAVLGSVLDGNLTEDERRELEPEVASLREFFIRMGETTLARADELSGPRQESPWRSMLPPSSRF